ncbi:MAG TPA: hypothetical protein VG722_13150 [Tepidisphaeraceae bacterium]|nr:hypothetical protein [Tepidisphaeraceae bacterium]
MLLGLLSLSVIVGIDQRTRAAVGEETVRIDGIPSKQGVEGEPYELAGNRVIFTNWYYVDPGDLDWRDDRGKSVYVKGNVDMLGAHFVGIRSPIGIELEAQKPSIMGPIFLPNRSIVHDGKLYKGWTNNEYYESADGIHWTKKANIIFKGPYEVDIYDVFLDPTAPPAERFKNIWADEMSRDEFNAFLKKRPDGWAPRGLTLLQDNKVECVRGGYSSDGITWTSLPDPLVVDYCDTLNTCYYDTVLRKYVMYTRIWSVGPQSRKVPVDLRNSWTNIGRRAIGRSESSDFHSFPPAQMIVEPTPSMRPSEQIYTNCHTTPPGAPDIHMMFPAIWNGSVTDTTRIAMLSSHDGKVWNWVPGGEHLIETQPFGQWNGGCVWTTPSLVELPDGDWALPYYANNVPHKYPRGQRTSGTGYAIWPKGRMVALEAAQRGQFTMIPLIVPGSKLKINALTLRTGWIKVGVLGKGGRSINECVPIVGDQFWKQVKWNNADDIGAKPNEPVRLVFELYQAKLFGLEFD